MKPASDGKLMRFLGAKNFLAAVVDHFAETVKPLYGMLKENGFKKKRKHKQRLIIPDGKQRWKPHERDHGRDRKTR